jgi:hypothetical protein
MNPSELTNFFQSLQPHSGPLPLSGCIVIPNLQKCIKSILSSPDAEIKVRLLREIKTNLQKS